MSLTQRLKQGFLRLPTAKKVILVSSFTLMASTVMPWYDQRNNFGVGDTYLGIQGPLFAAGIIVLACGAISFANLFFPLLGKNFFEMKRKSGSLALAMGAQALLVVLLANSVFYHPDFGTGVTNKATSFGMMAAFLSLGALLISGWWTRRKERAGGEHEEHEYEVEDAMEEPVVPQSSWTPAPQRSLYSEPEPAYEETPRYSAPTQNYQVPVTQSEPAQAVDPLTLDPKTRYKMMQSQNRYSSSARNNLWGSGNGSAYGGTPYGRNRVEE